RLNGGRRFSPERRWRPLLIWAGGTLSTRDKVPPAQINSATSAIVHDVRIYAVVRQAETGQMAAGRSCSLSG
ncbi:hypothetical protein, partial [Polymorphospora rubra]|uniref:hypothetical protein n=1 Tax=Polymorphospora rubra TaxID=338584 RepID=UPI0033C0E28B